MTDIMTAILSHPATGYILSFGGLGVVLLLAINGMHKRFKLSERTWGVLTLVCGAIGGVMLQDVGLVSLPGGGNIMAQALAAFMGACTAAAASAFSAVDLRKTITSKE